VLADRQDRLEHKPLSGVFACCRLLREEQQLVDFTAAEIGTLQMQPDGLRGNVDACAGRRECLVRAYIQQAVAAKHEDHSIWDTGTGLCK
jgi:hypothetical protein